MLEKKIAYLGPEGTYAEQAALKYSPKGKKIACSTIEDVFEATSSKKATLGIVPIENIIEGPVNKTLDELLKYEGKLRIVDTLILPIQHSIGVLPKSKEIKKIMSKDQALSQCSEYLHKNYNEAELIETASTAKAMEEIAEKEILDAAAIGDQFALKSYGLKILESNIGNIKNNKTKFAVLGNYFAEKTGKNCTAIMIYPHRDRAGLLKDIVDPISKRYINMLSIHSRPDTKGGFRFYLELEGHIKDTKIKDCIEDLKERLGEDYTDIKIFGSYPRRDFIKPKIKKIGIIGGTGKMGQWFKSFFKEAGYHVLISGRKTPLTYENCVKKSDVVIVNVPIKNTASTIKKIAPYFSKGKLIVDNASIKIQPLEAILKNVGENVEALGMHTIFGPKVKEICEQNVAFVHTEKSGEKAREFENIFYKYGAKIRITTAEEHDKQMAFHQNLEHFTKIVLAELIREEFGKVEDLDGFSSPNSQTSFVTMSRVLSSDLKLLSEIQRYNKKAPAIIKNYLKIANRIGKELIRNNPKYFEESARESINKFNEGWLKKKIEKSQKIQEILSKKELI